MHKRIRLGQLCPGMFVVNYGAGTFDDPFVELGYFIKTMDQIVELKERRIHELLIDIRLGCDVRFKDTPPQNTVSFEQELHVAEKLYVETLRHARSFMADVRHGKGVDYQQSLPLLDKLMQSVRRNRTAAGSLSKLRRFDEYTYTHCINVAVLSMSFGSFLGLDEEELRLIGLAGLYHDVGKALVPEKLLNKPGRFTPAEYAQIKTHPLHGYKLMTSQSGLDQRVLRAIVEHHERADGSGYPMGLAGDDISTFAQIIGIVDVYDALTSNRCYRSAQLPRDVLRIMFERRENDFITGLVERFIKCMGIYPPGSFVRLSDGRYGVVCETNTDQALAPRVKVALDSKLRPLTPEIVDTAVESNPKLSIVDCLDPAQFKIDVYRLVN
ncbi:MAG: HD-GYP domain-containing protein [Desulfovibrio sp.]|uniref:HD-GYP domain-containing protein n=1 Tax=Desulfovibrio sp. 7SRBS1 TaxID=3378064 RepID=UPI003B421406